MKRYWNSVYRQYWFNTCSSFNPEIFWSWFCRLTSLCCQSDLGVAPGVSGTKHLFLKQFCGEHVNPCMNEHSWHEKSHVKDPMPQTHRNSKALNGQVRILMDVDNVCGFLLQDELQPEIASLPRPLQRLTDLPPHSAVSKRQAGFLGYQCGESLPELSSHLIPTFLNTLSFCAFPVTPVRSIPIPCS